MISAVVDGTKTEPTFPALYKSGRIVILATAHDTYRREITGTVISGCNTFPIGMNLSSWNADEFKRWNGSVTLKNAD